MIVLMARSSSPLKSRTSVPSGIAAQIRERILRGQLPPGTRLIENSLSKELKAGQPTVREGLFMLEREGLVERVPTLGTFVRELGVREVGNLFQIRTELEGLAAELAAHRAKPEDLVKLGALADDMRTGAQERGKWGFLQADLAFHRYLWRLSGNAELCALLEPMVVPLLAFSYMQIERTTASLEESVAAHQSIATALGSGPREARAAVEANMRTFLNRYFSSLLESLLSRRQPFRNGP